MRNKGSQRSLALIFLAAFFFHESTSAQSNYAGQTIKWDDYTFKFLPG
ncbi:MAG TPA: hypothetical protein VN025_07375 [Candidatus Dormibacteraeota bacterium]|nr:hypothetical protein [Candidatus Dormibacteraeota bacterium]